MPEDDDASQRTLFAIRRTLKNALRRTDSVAVFANVLSAVVVALFSTGAGMLLQERSLGPMLRDIFFSRVFVFVAVGVVGAMLVVTIVMRLRARAESDAVTRLRRITKDAYSSALREAQLVRGGAKND